METYKKYLNEATISSKNWKYMGKANDAMADFLGEIEEKMGAKTAFPSKIEAELAQIDSLWNKYWDRLIKLTREVEKLG